MKYLGSGSLWVTTDENDFHEYNQWLVTSFENWKLCPSWRWCDDLMRYGPLESHTRIAQRLYTNTSECFKCSSRRIQNWTGWKWCQFLSNHVINWMFVQLKLVTYISMWYTVCVGWFESIEKSTSTIWWIVHSLNIFTHFNPFRSHCKSNVCCKSNLNNHQNTAPKSFRTITLFSDFCQFFSLSLLVLVGITRATQRLEFSVFYGFFCLRLREL